ncbi:IspD/TarI family cytidylyltransferase, partial [Glutamicibacter creatinolyticus]|uniref:IspD/TarI family cytidylyltransferase n=1 Tax=Glutamicibacter creatinolyticus TaxID=162496 RepID=UPI003B9820B6
VDQRLTRILVHDVARALTPPDTFERVLQTLEDPQRPAVIPALPVTDTISVVEQTSGSDTVRDTPARASLRAVQTP